MKRNIPGDELPYFTRKHGELDYSRQLQYAYPGALTTLVAPNSAFRSNDQFLVGVEIGRLFPYFARLWSMFSPKILVITSFPEITMPNVHAQIGSTHAQLDLLNVENRRATVDRHFIHNVLTQYDLVLGAYYIVSVENVDDEIAEILDRSRTFIWQWAPAVGDVVVEQVGDYNSRVVRTRFCSTFVPHNSPESRWTSLGLFGPED